MRVLVESGHNTLAYFQFNFFYVPHWPKLNLLHLKNSIELSGEVEAWNKEVS